MQETFLTIVTEITENCFCITSSLSQSETHFLSSAPLNWQVSRKSNFLLSSFSSFAAACRVEAFTLLRRVSWRISGTFQAAAQPTTSAGWSRRLAERTRADWWESRWRALPEIARHLLRKLHYIKSKVKY